jgi:hypothetical protein
MIIHTMPQRSEEWFKVRLGKFTGTDLDKLMPTPKQTVDDFNSAQIAIIYRVAAERMTGLAKGSDWGSVPKEWGIETEAEARIAYSFATGYAVEEVGFVEFDEWFGVSPDGLVPDPLVPGGVELKCPNSDTHLRYLVKPDDLIADYGLQCEAAILATGRDWWDLVSFDPRFTDECTQLVHVRIVRDSEKIDKIIARLAYAVTMVKRIMA